MKAQMAYIQALSPIHAGTGQAVSVIDLPISREKTTGWPNVPGSSIKGVMRDRCRGLDGECSEGLLDLAFGPDTEHSSDNAGEIIFGDAQLLLLPVRSFFGTFARATCPLALRRLRRDHKALGLACEVPTPAVAAGECLLGAEGSVLAHDGRVYLEDLDFGADSNPESLAVAEKLATALAPEGQREDFMKRLLILDDDSFTYLTETAVAVAARIRLKEDTKTVDQGGLWYEESLPSEAVLYSPWIVTPRKAEEDKLINLLGCLAQGIVQIGGNATVGRGLCRIALSGGVA